MFLLPLLPLLTARNTTAENAVAQSNRLCIDTILKSPGADVMRRTKILQHLAIKLTPVLEKMLLDPEPVHRVLADYLSHANPLAVYDAAETLSGPQLLRIVHTRSGSQASCLVVAAGTAKDRKKVVKVSVPKPPPQNCFFLLPRRRVCVRERERGREGGAVMHSKT